METIIDSTEASPSMSDLRSMLAPPTATEAKPETAEPVAPATTKFEAESETAAKSEEPKTDESEDEPLPKNVQKKIEHETARAAKAQAAIDRAVSDRKAKEDQVAKLTKANQDQNLSPTTEPESNGKPIRPTEDKYSTWGEYQEALAKYDSDREAWLMADVRKTVEQEFTQRQQQSAAKVRWDEAIKTHGAGFPDLMAKAQAAPEGLQLAISSLDDWSGVAVHLANNPAKLQELAAKFATNPYQAIATLGRIEASLKPAPQAAAEPLPKPPVVEGGKSSASVGAFDYEAASMSQLRAHVTKLRGR